jgi:hypothetical protein
MPRAWLLSFGLLGVAVAEPAWAAPVEGCDLECPLGTTCQFAPFACALISCPEDNPDCVVCDDEGPGTPYCGYAACETDSDCGDSMKCVDNGFECASGERATAAPAIAPAAGDADEPRANLPAPPACEQRVVRQCTPRWQLPCATDSDCGAGFRCEETESCSVPPYDPSSGEPPSSEVTCAPSGTFACKLIETACDTEAECPADFVCVDNPNGTCSASSDGQTQCEPGDPPRLCAPPAVPAPLTGELASSNAETASAPAGLPSDDTGLTPAASEGGCTLNGAAPAGPLALLSTLGLGLAFSARRRRSNAR